MPSTTVWPGHNDVVPDTIWIVGVAGIALTVTIVAAEVDEHPVVESVAVTV